jgi:hypothetical protein
MGINGVTKKQKHCLHYTGGIDVVNWVIGEDNARK